MPSAGTTKSSPATVLPAQSAPEFTYEELQRGAAFEYLSHISSAYERAVEVERLAKSAKDLKFQNFKKLFGLYQKQKEAESSKNIVPAQDGLTEFDEQPIELNCGAWRADELGVWRYGAYGNTEIACSHPIIPVARLRNIDTGEIKVQLKYRRGNQRRAWNEITVGYDTIASARNIVNLANVGISVTSGTRAQLLVDYLSDVMDQNYDDIPEKKSVTRMGWNEEGFSPYVQEIVFDGADSFSSIYKTIAQRGHFDKWRAEAVSARQYSLTEKIVLAASFASVLIEPLGCLPFFVHLWGMDSGTGKTVGQMLAASVWANPSLGGAFFPTFKATSVGFEVIATFLNSLPVFIDELQLAKKNGTVNFNVYELCAGSGKLRSNRSLGIAARGSWANCFITSGESPIVSENDGAGAVNRVLEIECRAAEKVIEDGHKTASLVKANYGHAGKIFVEMLSMEGALDRAKGLYEAVYAECLKTDTTEKQAMAAALLVVADKLATELIFQDGNELTVKQIAEFLKSKNSVSASERGYETMCGWVAQNYKRFVGESDGSEVYGKLEEPEKGGRQYAAIIRTVFDGACEKFGLSPRALLSHLRSKGLLKTRDGRANTMCRRIGGVSTECVIMQLPPDPEAWVQAAMEGEALPM